MQRPIQSPNQTGAACEQKVRQVAAVFDELKRKYECWGKHWGKESLSIKDINLLIRFNNTS